jgi:hypothetical protein
MMQIRVKKGRLIRAWIDIGLWWKYEVGSQRRMRSVRLGKTLTPRISRPIYAPSI